MSISSGRITAVISGRVQGVYYRGSTRRQVMKIGGITGWVKNQEDGTVRLTAEGSPEKLQELMDWCNSGPPMAIVTSINIQHEKPTGEFHNFTILY